MPARKPAPPPFLTLGWQLIDWLEAMLVHGPGDVQGQPYRLTDEAAAFVVRAYAVDETGRRLIRRAYLSRCKGWSKTELAGALAAAELVGPVRFDGFDANGDPVGVPIVGPQVRCFATEEGQAGTTYSTAAFMLEHGPAADEYQLDLGVSRTFERTTNGRMLAESSAPSSAEGGRDTFNVFDETHLWTTPSLRELHNVARRNLGSKRARAEPWSLETSAMFEPGAESVAEVLFRHWQRIAAGEFGPSDEALDQLGLLVDHLQAPNDIDLDDDDALELGLRIAAGDAAEFIDFERRIAEVRDPQTDEASARRYFLNQPVRGEDSWLDEHDLKRFDKLAAPHEVADGTTIALGFDGSLSDDATVLIGCTLERGGKPYVWPIGIWAAPENPRERAEWTVDRDDVNAAVDDTFERYTVVLAYCDPAYWTPELASWASRYGDDVVREFPTGRDYRMGPAQTALRTALKTAGLEHDGDPVVRRHFANARARRTRHGVTIRKDSKDSPRKIDAAVGYALAFTARNDALAANLDQRRRRRRRRGGAAPAKLITF